MTRCAKYTTLHYDASRLKVVIIVILNERLKKLRAEKNVTQQKVADALGVTVGNVQKFEYGTARPKLDNVIKIADFFDVSLDYLVGRTDNPAVLRG